LLPAASMRFGSLISVGTIASFRLAQSPRTFSATVAFAVAPLVSPFAVIVNW
jgi:hypothetical protein